MILVIDMISGKTKCFTIKYTRKFENYKSKNAVYQLADFFTMFYFQFIKNQPINDQNYWIHTVDSPKHRAWSGYAFERVCLAHALQIKKALGISGVKTYLFSWKSKEAENQSQIDLDNHLQLDC